VKTCLGRNVRIPCGSACGLVKDNWGFKAIFCVYKKYYCDCHHTRLFYPDTDCPKIAFACRDSMSAFFILLFLYSRISSVASCSVITHCLSISCHAFVSCPGCKCNGILSRWFFEAIAVLCSFGGRRQQPADRTGRIFPWPHPCCFNLSIRRRVPCIRTLPANLGAAVCMLTSQLQYKCYRKYRLLCAIRRETRSSSLRGIDMSTAQRDIVTAST